MKSHLCKALSIVLSIILITGALFNAFALETDSEFYFGIYDSEEVYFDLYNKESELSIQTESKAVSADNSFKGSFGSKLSGIQKEIYDELVENYVGLDGMSNGVTESCAYSPKSNYNVTSFSTIHDDVCYAYISFIYDNPQMFWSRGLTYSVTYADYGSYYSVLKIKITLHEKYSGAINSISEFKTNVNKAVDEIYASVKESFSVYDYYKAVYNWVAKKCTYNFDATNDVGKNLQAYSSGGVFAGDGKVVCQGYAEAYKIICDQLKRRYGTYGTNQLDCILVSGKASNLTTKEDHEWNFVKMPDNNWYALDITWDDAGTYANNKYFMVGSTTEGVISGNKFVDEHIAEGVFDLGTQVQLYYPILSEKEYMNIQCKVDFITYESGSEKVLRSNIVNKYGYITENIDEDWYIDKEFTRLWNFSDMIEESLNLYFNSNVVLGDVNNDNYISIDDVTLIQMYLIGISEFSEQQLVSAEVNGDGEVTIDDATAIQMYLAGFSSALIS